MFTCLKYLPQNPSSIHPEKVILEADKRKTVLQMDNLFQGESTISK